MKNIFYITASIFCYFFAEWYQKIKIVLFIIIFLFAYSLVAAQSIESRVQDEYHQYDPDYFTLSFTAMPNGDYVLLCPVDNSDDCWQRMKNICINENRVMVLIGYRRVTNTEVFGVWVLRKAL